MALTRWKDILKGSVRNVYRLVILQEETLEEKASLRLNPLNLYLIGSAGIVVLISLTVILIVYTPLKEYIPGYSDTRLKREVNRLYFKVDSLNNTLSSQQRYLNNLISISKNEIGKERDTLKSINPKLYDEALLSLSGGNDSLLRVLIEGNDDVEVNDLPSDSKQRLSRPVAGGAMMGYVKDQSSKAINIKIANGGPVLACEDGRIISSGFTSGFGNQIVVQHSGGLISVYNGLNKILMKKGTLVKSGDAIGMLSQGNNTLVFELWLNGVAMDPVSLIQF